MKWIFFFFRPDGRRKCGYFVSVIRGRAQIYDGDLSVLLLSRAPALKKKIHFDSNFGERSCGPPIDQFNCYFQLYLWPKEKKNFQLNQGSLHIIRWCLSGFEFFWFRAHFADAHKTISHFLVSGGNYTHSHALTLHHRDCGAFRSLIGACDPP